MGAGLAGQANIAVLFTDLVGSTAVAERVGPVGAEALRREHFGLLRAACDRHAGREVKSLGDGLMVVFALASDAIGAAIAGQQALDRRNHRSDGELLSVRMGVSFGVADMDEGDAYGAPIVEAARLCALADGGEILVTQLV